MGELAVSGWTIRAEEPTCLVCVRLVVDTRSHRGASHDHGERAPATQRIRMLRLASVGACYGEIMSDNSVVRLLREFVSEREWSQFHSSSNLAKSISIEAGELLECFQWGEEADPMRVQSELADVLTYAYLLADRLGLDPDTIVAEKLEETRTKYPVEKARGRSSKYDEL
jgi:dCTP diphosphatase